MGKATNVGIGKYPAQGTHYLAKVEVCFNYDPTQTLQGQIVRDDIEEPHLTIIKLDDGRYILATECQYSVIEYAKKH